MFGELCAGGFVRSPTNASMDKSHLTVVTQKL